MSRASSLSKIASANPSSPWVRHLCGHDETRATRDGGKDLLAYMETELGTLLCLVEAKNYRRDRKVGVELVRSLYGTLIDAEASSAMLITTSSFTSDAQEFQRRHRYRLALKDYDDLSSWIRQYRRRPN